MRILQIRFQNLNSLVGEWEIDLTHPAYIADGIFAITGPTGAGKSTILDAICLALYGKTPRLARVTKNENEIMSRRTGFCFADVCFETQSGRYRCHWSQHRSRHRPGGELQNQKHELVDADTGRIIASSIRGVEGQVEKVTGMDFDRFTRSMLLAQGGFDVFLKADADQRAPILEQITGMEIYGRISKRVHERQRQEREALKLLQAETTSIVVLTAEQETQIRQALAAGQNEEKDLAARCAESAKAITWLTTINELKKEISDLADVADKLRDDMETFKPDREKLNRALNAATMDGIYATLSAIRTQQADDRAAWKTATEARSGFESSAREQADKLKSAEQQSVRAKEEWKAAVPVLQKIRFLDQKLADQQQAVSEGEEECKRLAARMDADKKSRREEQNKGSRAFEKRDLVRAYLEDHAQDEWLIGGLAGLEEQLSGLLSRQNEIVQKEAAHEAAVTALERATKLLGACQKKTRIQKQKLEEVSKQLQQGREGLSQILGDRLLREYRSEKESLLREMAFLTKIAELEDYRAKLEDGKPCPLCGAIQHPFAEGNVPVPDEIETKINALTQRIRHAEEQEAAIRQLETAETLARNKLTEVEKQESAAANDEKAAAKTLADLKESLGKLHADLAERRQAVMARLQPLGIADIPATDISSLIESLRARRKAWLAKLEEKAEIEKQLADIDSELKRLDAVIETQSVVLNEQRERLANLKMELAAGSEERRETYSDKNPDEEEGRLQQAVADAESVEKQARESYHEFQQTWNTTKAHVESLQKRIEGREPERIRQENVFAAALAEAGFSNEEQFLAAMLPAETRAALTARVKELDQRQADLNAKRKDREARLATEQARKISEASLEELIPRLKESEESLTCLREEIAGLKHRLQDNTAAIARLKGKREAIEARKAECRRWDDLHALIGSSDGKKYRNFAQGLTFEMLIAHANQQLQKLSDRYLLVRDRSQSLELNVIDQYQAGEVRSTKNLSGGEGFLVSLSLALGLSRMASRRVRVDSLFLDEGFGTLDEEALDTALETMAGLRRDGKLIAVISHVPALKERIGTQIRVLPLRGGRSQIQGPGCRFVPSGSTAAADHA